jgi:hypothetical protein
MNRKRKKHKFIRTPHFFRKWVRRLSRFAWSEMLWDVSRVEWKYGRNDDGSPKNWDEWNNVRDHLQEHRSLRRPEELGIYY